MTDAPPRPSLDHLRAELLAIDRDLRAADAIGWGKIWFELTIAVRALSPISTWPGETHLAAQPIDPEKLRDRLLAVRAALEGRLADGIRPMLEPSVSMAATAVNAAIVIVLREIGGFAQAADHLVATIITPAELGAA